MSRTQFHLKTSSYLDMHGLIFKIKESHRQDQSESFVIYIYAYTYIDIYMYMLYFHNKSNEITSL